MADDSPLSPLRIVNWVNSWFNEPPPPQPSFTTTEENNNTIGNEEELSELDKFVIKNIDKIAGVVFGILVVGIGFTPCVLGALTFGVGLAVKPYVSMTIEGDRLRVARKIQALFKSHTTRFLGFMGGIVLLFAAPQPTSYVSTIFGLTALYNVVTIRFGGGGNNQKNSEDKSD